MQRHPPAPAGREHEHVPVTPLGANRIEQMPLRRPIGARSQRAQIVFPLSHDEHHAPLRQTECLCPRIARPAIPPKTRGNERGHGTARANQELGAFPCPLLEQGLDLLRTAIPRKRSVAKTASSAIHTRSAQQAMAVFQWWEHAHKGGNSAQENRSGTLLHRLLTSIPACRMACESTD